MRFLAVIFISFMVVSNCFAQNLETKYFSVKFKDGTSKDELAYALRGSPATQIDATLFTADPFAAMLDSLYLEVCDILDIHIYDMKINMEVTKTLKEKAYYNFNVKTIFLGAAQAAPGILAHELAHAVIMRYFVVPPPEKLQEVMCGYVEYQVNKKANNAAH